MPIIFGHMGGYNWIDVLGFAKQAENVYIDLSAAFSTLAVKMALTEVPEKCIFSSDAPYGDVLLCKEMIEYLSPSKRITDLVLGENMMQVIQKSISISQM